MSVAEWLCPPDEEIGTLPQRWNSDLLGVPIHYQEQRDYSVPLAFKARPRKLVSGSLNSPLQQSRIREWEGLQAVLKDIHSMLGADAESEREGVAPSTATISRSVMWVFQFHAEITASGSPWIKPHVVANPAGEIVFSWWHGNRTLTVYVTGDGAEYVESWGVDITTEMDDGSANSMTTCRGLWSRLARG